MSTVKVTNLSHASAGSPAIVLDADGDAAYAGTHDFSAATVTGIPDGPQGLTLISPTSIANSGGSASASGGAVTFTDVTSLSLNGVFTSDYDNYRIVVSRDASAGGTLDMRLRVGGVDTSSADYDYIRVFVYGTSSVAGARGLSATSWYLGYMPTVRIGMCSADIFGPNLTASTQYSAIGGSAQELTTSMGELDLATSYDGLTLIPSAGDMTGKIRVYGYKN